MILFIANHSFPDDSGFSNRCRNALEVLHKRDDVVMVCQKGSQSLADTYNTTTGPIPMHRFSLSHQSIERTTKADYLTGLYELKRNIDLFCHFVNTLWSVVRMYKSKGELKVYVVVSPLTTPFFVYICSLILPITLEVVEFHDLEPETAKHIKQLSNSSLVMKVEYVLEKYMCRVYKKVVVTNTTQKERLVARTNIPAEKICVLPNIVPIEAVHKVSREKYHLHDNDFVLAYSSNLSYDYTTAGVVSIIQQCQKILTSIPRFKFLIMGDGDGLAVLQAAIKKNHCQQHIFFLKRVSHVQEVLAIADVTIVPWLQNEMTETILPTKLFEYMAAKKAIIAPNFGEFRNNIKNRKMGLLYKKIDEIPDLLSRLYKDKKLRSSLGENAYTYYRKHYNHGKIMNHFARFLTQ